MNIKRIFLIVLLFSTYCYCSSHNIIGNNYNEKSNLTITNVYVVGLVLEWYPINDMNGKQGFIFLNTFLWLKEGDFKIIPIFPWYTPDQQEETLKLCNLVVWMGGMQDFTSGMTSKLENFYKTNLNIIENRKIPFFAICQGFQLLISLVKGKRVLTDFDNNKGDFQSDQFYKKDSEFLKSDMLFSKFNQEDIDIYQTKNVNYHFHKYGISIKDFYKEELNNVFNISTFGTDIKGQKFVNSIFHKDLPIHGVQYHPETSNFLTYKNDINEDYYWSRKLSFKTLQGIKDIIKNKGPKIEVELNDEILEKVYELSTIPLLVEDKYNTGKSTLKGYLFSFEDFPFKLK